MKPALLYTGCLLLFVFCGISARSQRPAEILRTIGNRVPGGASGSAGGGGTSGDSVKARNRFEDSLTLRITYLDSSGVYKMDSSVRDFTMRYPIPADHIYLGNTGVATRSILFAPRMQAGWDPGFHSLDVYKWKLEKVRFINTTRPYTELGYMLGSRAEQNIEILHTQNIRPNWNFTFNYRLINSPGFFRNQKTNHNNYLFTNWYQSKSKRYNNYFVLLGNTLQAGESGGIRNDRDYLNDIVYAKDRFLIPTKIGGDPQYGTDFFSTSMYTGTRYREFNLMLRQQYDFGKKDSVVTDSIVVPLSYPSVRFEHSFTYGKYRYSYQDFPVSENQQTNRIDSAYYYDHYRLDVKPDDSILFRDNWKEITNDFSIYQFPDSKNLNQFFKLGARLQVLQGNFSKNFFLSDKSMINAMAHGEYRNRTRNRKWDMLAYGNLYLGGYNLGDYHAYVHLQRSISEAIGNLRVGFENVNRTPPFLFDRSSAFYLDAPKSFNKENTIHFFSSLQLSKLKMQLSADYYLLTNYLYINRFFRLQQEGTLFNVLRISGLKTFRIGRHWNWHAELYLQQKTGSAEVNMPAIYTRHRFMYEGKLGFKNLDMAFGLEGKYHTPYKADNYSPVLGQFFYQDSVRISNLPDVHGFIHFRIRSFRAYLRFENLNTARLFGGFQFNNNNLAAPDYPTPGLVTRLGILWSFVN